MRSDVADDTERASIIKRVSLLPESTQRALCFAACVGEVFDLGTLSAVMGRSVPLIAADLASALDADLIAHAESRAHRFLGARTRETVISLVPGRDLPALHLAVGRRMLASRPEEAARHLDEGAYLLEAALRDVERQLVMQDKLAGLGTLLAGVAHEIKNPLNFVKNFSELSVELCAELRSEIDRSAASQRVVELTADLAENVGKIRDHAARAEGITRGMLEQSRGRAGQARDTDLNALVRAYAGVAAEGEGRGVRAVEVRVDDSVGMLCVVPEDIGRVVLNLVTNALHAAHAQRITRGDGFTPHVRVSTHGDRDHVEVRVRDNGAGIPEGLRDRVFLPFFTTKPQGEGTGLGLSISQEIVTQRHGGTLTFTSKEGDHTEFVMVLPRVPPPRARGDAARAARTAP